MARSNAQSSLFGRLFRQSVAVDLGTANTLIYTDDGLPRTVELSTQDVVDAIAAPLRQVLAAVKTALESAPPELVTDIADAGIVLTGGGALLGNLARYFSNELGLEVRVADEPLTCAVRGAGAAASAGLLEMSAYD